MVLAHNKTFRMKLAEVVAVYPPYRGGIGTVARDNARMASLGDWDVTVYTPLYPSQQGKVLECEVQCGVQIKRIKPLLSYRNAAIMTRLFSELRHVDVVHLHYPLIGSEWVTLLACLVYRKKLIVTYHMDLVGEGIFRPIYWLYTKIFLPLVMYGACHVFVTSWDYAENSYVQKYISRQKSRFSELPCVVDTNTFRPQKKSAPILNKFGLLDTDKIILFVGGLDRAHYFKGVDLLIDAFASIVSEFTDAHLVIVGDGDMRTKYEAHAENIHMTNTIHFAGSASDEELPLYYASSDICVLPSLDESEAFGIVLVEAMSCGKPVIASHIRGVRSVVRDGVDGIIVKAGSQQELSNALRELLVNNDKRLAMSVSAREHVLEKYSFDHVQKTFLTAISGGSL